MKKNLTILVLLLASYQTFSQIVQLPLDAPFPYDNGIGMPLETYRLFRTKTVKCDTLLTAKDSTISAMASVQTELENKIGNRDEKIVSYQNTIVRKDIVIDSMQVIHEESITLLNESEPKKSWMERKETWISGGIGLLLGILITK